jgi:hypothetical protein
MGIRRLSIWKRGRGLGKGEIGESTILYTATRCRLHEVLHIQMVYVNRASTFRMQCPTKLAHMRLAGNCCEVRLPLKRLHRSYFAVPKVIVLLFTL